MPIIEAIKLKKVYDEGESETVALSDATFSINKGEFVAVIGPSGCGKSTLLHILGFLERHTSGTYKFDGKTIDDYTEDELAKIRNTKMGFVFQAFNLLARTTVLENVKLPLMYSNIAELSWDKRAREAIESVGLSHRLNHESSQLSGGEKQRVAIARALVMQPEVIFADEPTGNLDSKSGRLVMEILQELSEKREHTVVLITHETYTAEHAERIIEFKDGEIVHDTKVAHRHNAKQNFNK
ncbi:MAG: ABC transporter ATP-binding protein [bacterium]|nr:ABC transporter ATP-binding protein [bacterium]